MCEPARSEVYSVAARLGYPIILKRSASFAGSGVSRIANAVELASRLSGKETHGPFLVQRFVNGRVGTTTMLLDHGRPIRWFSFYTLHHWPTPFSPCGGGELTNHPQIEQMMNVVAPLHGFHGICGIDWIQETATGRFYFVEFNPRVTPTAYRGTWAGTDFASALAEMAAGGKSRRFREPAARLS